MLSLIFYLACNSSST